MKRFMSIVAWLAMWLACCGSLRADTFAAGDIIDWKFTTRQTTGAPFTLAGSPVVKVYKTNSTTTEVTTGVTLSVDFDSVTGLNSLRIDTTADGTFYSNGSSFQAVITTGTVNSVSVVGETVLNFRLEKAPLKPTTVGRDLDVSAGGEAGIDWANIGSPTTANNLSATTTNLVNTATTLTNKTGFELSSNGILAAWDIDGQGNAVGSLAHRMINFLDGTITSRAVPGDLMGLANDAITSAKIAADSIGASEIAGGAINVSEAPNLDAAISSISAGTSPTILQTGTLTVTNQTTVVLSAGSADDDAYNNQLMIIVDQATSTQKATTPISDYVGGSKTATITAPIFTIATGDTFYIIAAPPATVSGTVNANLVQIGGVTQSATDLKDFADDGYDPSTNKVQGVVLADTVTTLTNKTGFALTSGERDSIAQVVLGTDGAGYGAGTTGFLVHQFLDAAISTRSSHAAGDVWAVGTRQLTGTQSFNVTGNITGNLSGTVGSVTGAVGSVTGNVGGNVVGSVGSATTLGQAGIDAIFNEPTAGNQTAGTFGKAITDASSAGNPWSALTADNQVAGSFGLALGGGGGGGLTEQQTVNSLLLVPVGTPAVGSPMASLLAIEASGVTIPELAAGLLANNVAGEDDVGAGGGFSSDERAQVLAALSITAETGVPKALTWTIARINGQMRARASIPKDASESVEALADFRDVLGDNDAIADAVDGGIVAIALINDTGSETVTSTAFGAPQNATVWMNAGVKFTIAGGTAGDTDRIRVTVLTTGGNTLSAPCTVVVSGEE